MKQEDMIKLVLSGHCVLVGVYGGGAVKAREYTDRETGKTRQLRGISHTFIAGSRPVLVQEYLPDGQDVNTIQIKQVVGKRYVLVVESVQEDKGVMRARMNGMPMEELV
jgi:hypothetical protein